MRTLLLGLSVILAALPLGCSVQANDATNPENSTGGQASEMTAGTGGSGDTPNEGGEGGVPAGSGDGVAAARLESCEAICATEAELPCPPDAETCVSVWCEEQPQAFPPCVAPYDVMLACLAQAPADSYTCVDDMPYPKPETCAAEQEVLVTCLQDLG